VKVGVVVVVLLSVVVVLSVVVGVGVRACVDAYRLVTSPDRWPACRIGFWEGEWGTPRW